MKRSPLLNSFLAAVLILASPCVLSLGLADTTVSAQRLNSGNISPYLVGNFIELL